MNTVARTLRSRITTIGESLTICTSSGLWVHLGIFALISLVNFHLVFGHVFWRDEALPLLIAIKNPSLAGFFHAMRYEGTPALWHSILWLMAKIVPLTPLAAQVIHFVIAEAIAALVLFGLQVPFIYRVIILLQEPFVWNAQNVRQYQLAGGLILLFALLYNSNRRHRMLAIALTLGLLAQTCLHGTIVAAILFVFFLFNHRTALRHPANIIVCLSIVFALAQMIPPGDLMEGLHSWTLAPSPDRLLYVLTSLSKSVLLTNPFLIAGFLVIQFAAFIRLYTTDSNKACAFFLAITICFLAFGFIAYTKISGPRQYWLLTYMIIALLVINYQNIIPRISRIRGLTFAVLLLAISLYNYIDLILGEPSQLKSQSQNLATYLDANYPTKTVLSKSEIFEAPVRLYRKSHPPEFALGRQAYVDYTVWNHPSVDFVHNARSEHIYLSDLRSDLARTDPMLLDTEPLVIVSGFELVNDEPNGGWAEISINENYRLQLVEVFEHALNENYAVYIVRHTNRAASNRVWNR